MVLLIWAVCLLAAVSQLQRGPTEQITLLPNQDGKPSAVIITTAGKDTVLDKPYQTAAVSRGAVATTSDSAQIKNRYGALIDTLPQRAAVFIVYFITDTIT
jgi:hypothetical protein